MKLHHIVGIAAATLAGLGVGGSAVSAGSETSSPNVTTELAAGDDAPPTGIDEFVAPDGREASTTCEGTVTCKLLEGACGLVGGTYTGWPSQDRGHDHTHGICTWPWE